MIRILAIDDHELVRTALCRMLSAEPDLDVVGQASTFEEAWPLLLQERPDVVTLDLELPGCGGREAALRILQELPDTSVLIVSYRAVPDEIAFLVEAGVQGYVCKSAPAAELGQAVRAVAMGLRHLSDEAAQALESRSLPENPLTLRQTEVLLKMERGKTTREIAREMNLSPKTVEKYRSAILARFGARNQVEALRAARELGLLDA